MQRSAAQPAIQLRTGPAQADLLTALGIGAAEVLRTAGLAGHAVVTPITTGVGKILLMAAECLQKAQAALYGEEIPAMILFGTGLDLDSATDDTHSPAASLVI